MDWLLNFAMKGNIDKEASLWDSMFLPAELEAAVSKLMITDENGEISPFVKNKTVYNRAEGRALIPEMPPRRWPIGLIAGAILAILAVLLRHKAEDSIAARRGFALLSALLTLILGMAGSLLLFMACFTDHSFAYWNQNLLFINPIMIITFAFSLRLLFNRKASIRSLNICWILTTSGIILSIILKIIPFFRQDNWTSILLVLLPAMVFSGLSGKLRTFIPMSKARNL